MGEISSLSDVQRRFLGKCRKDPKPIGEMLWECQIGIGTFLQWRENPEFAREFRAVSSDITRDTLAELRMAFVVCGRMISDEVFAIELKRTQKRKRGKKALARQAQREERPILSDAEHRFCFDVVKLGMSAFVPKRLPRKKPEPFPKVDPEAFARLERAQGD
jgi:hypothetical protein